MCNCEKEIEEKILNKADDKDKVINYNKALSLEGNIMYYTEYVATKDTKTKSGKKRTLKEKFNMLWKYCPYCGENLE